MKTLIFFLTYLIFNLTNQSINPLLKTDWSLIKISNNTADSTCGIYLHFGIDGKYNGYSGWNNYQGKYSIGDNKQLRMDNPIRTKKAGHPNCEFGESLYGYFPKIKIYQIQADTLYLFMEDGEKIVFKGEINKPKK